MLSVTLNSRRGSNLGVIPSTQINTYVLNNATMSVGSSTLVPSITNNTVLVGDTFTFGPNTYTFSKINSLQSYNFKPNLLTGMNNAGLFLPVTTTHSQTLGYKVCAGTVHGNLPIGASVISFHAPSLSTTLSIIHPYASLVIGTDVYGIEKISYSPINNTNMLSITPPLKTVTDFDSTIMTIYEKTFNTMSYNIDTSIFKKGVKYELSFSFQSYPCIINQCYNPASVYVDLGSSSTYESGTTNINSTSLLGLLKPNFIHSNMNTALYGNVSYGTLVADPSNKPIIINPLVNNVLTVNILNDNEKFWGDNSNVSICPPYEITFHFKEISV